MSYKYEWLGETSLMRIVIVIQEGYTKIVFWYQTIIQNHAKHFYSFRWYEFGMFWMFWNDLEHFGMFLFFFWVVSLFVETFFLTICILSFLEWFWFLLKKLGNRSFFWMICFFWMTVLFWFFLEWFGTLG